MKPSLTKRPSLKVLASQKDLEEVAKEPDHEKFLSEFKRLAEEHISNAYR